MRETWGREYRIAWRAREVDVPTPTHHKTRDRGNSPIFFDALNSATWYYYPTHVIWYYEINKSETDPSFFHRSVLRCDVTRATYSPAAVKQIEIHLTTLKSPSGNVFIITPYQVVTNWSTSNLTFWYIIT